MRRLLTRTLLLTCVLAAAIGAAFTQVASANYLGGVNITCTGATFSYSTFPDGAQSVLETIFVDGAIAKQTTFSFTGPTGTDTVQFSVPNDGAEHTIEANAYSLTNSTPVFGLPGVVKLTCSNTPPPPPASVCTYTQGYYKNHATAVAGVIAGMAGGKIQVGSMSLTDMQAQAVFNEAVAVSSAGNSKLLLVLAKQLITAELNVARGSSASAGVQAAIASANAAITTSISPSFKLTSALTTPEMSSLVDALDAFNSGSDCS